MTEANGLSSRDQLRGHVLAVAGPVVGDELGIEALLVRNPRRALAISA